MSTPTAPVRERHSSPYLTVNCWITQQPGTPADWPDGHAKCEAPGYQHPVLGWMPVPCTCTCTCHTTGQP